MSSFTNGLNLKNFFYDMNHKLEKIKVEHDYIKDNWDYYATRQPDVFDSCYESYKLWEKQLLKHLDSLYKVRVKTITSPLQDNYLVLKTILRDMYWKYDKKKSKSEKEIVIVKLLKAREGNIEFELELAEMITGKNIYFPLRSQENIKNFFQNLGEEISLPVQVQAIYDRDQRNELYTINVERKLKELSIDKIHNLITAGLLKKKYFKKYLDKKNNNYDLDSFFKQAKKEFKEFIQNSITDNNPFNLSSLLDMNVNIELLFDNKANTEDKELNKLIEEAKERFLSNDKQIGLEKLWDAYERLKTHFGKNKKVSAPKVIKIISENFDEKFLTDEFSRLGKIGNNYRIRHHETDKKELTSKHINYFFFRMMSLIDLCLMYLNEEEAM